MMINTEKLLADVDQFKEQCERAQYTDTGMAWQIIDALYDALKATLDTSDDVDYRSAETGRYVTEGEALESPGTTIRENG